MDDELKACSILKNLLIKYVDPDINIAGIANNTKDAEELVHKLRPDAVFLDVEMPGENAFNFLKRISPISFEVVFVTAYDDYAIKALRLNAVDYILKPISINELRNAIERLKDRLKLKKNGRELKSSYSELSCDIDTKAKQHKIILKDKNNTEVVYFKDIFYIEAQGSYSRVFFRKFGSVKEITMSWLVTDYEELLPADQFFRIHRSYLINCSHINRILNEEVNYVLLNNEFKLPVSRRSYTPLIDFLKINDFIYE